MRALAVAALTAAALVGAGCGGKSPGARTTTTTGAAPAPQVALPTPGRPGLAIGVSEANANLLLPPDASDPPAAAFRPWQRRLTDLHPQLYRLPIDWSTLQPDPDQPARLDQRQDGCARGTPPCAAYAGLRDQLRALAAQQRAGNGFATLVVFYGVPEWAAAAAHGCEADGAQPRSRPITDRGLEAYKALVRQVADLADREGAALQYWAPWNEPNGNYFISPQRARCDADSPPLSPGVYARLARAMRGALGGRPGQRDLVIGELAGVAQGSPRGTGSGEFLRALPDDVVCGAAVLSQHAYAHLPGQKQRSGDPVAALLRARAARSCTRDTPVWITETGTGGLHVGEPRDTGAAALRQQCVAYDRQLERWYRDGRIQAAFQYTFREDSAFPVGLVDAGLTTAYPTYDLVKAWSTRASPEAAPPALPASCRGG